MNKNERRRQRYANLPPDEKEKFLAKNREKTRAYREAKLAENPDYNREIALKYSFGLGVEDYERMLSEQNGVCAICSTDKPGGRWDRFHVDHCHDTGKIRGLLCNNCNRGLGLLNSTLKLFNAAKYLERHNGH